MTAEQLQAYREQRAKYVSPAFINMEMGAVRRILKRAKRWHLIGEELKPLREGRKIGRALSEEEKRKLLHLAASNPEWLVARCAAVLALNTTMRGCELKGLRWRDVNLLDRTATVHRSKTEAGERVIPLNNDAMAVVHELFKRAEVTDGAGLNHYVFPACENGKLDHTRPQVTWRTAWRKLTRTIQCPACGQLQNPAKTCCNDACNADISKVKSSTAGLRFHDLRHHAITELAESKTSDQTIMAIAGHVSQKMLAHYSHVRIQAMRTALNALGGDGTKEGYDTNNDTKRFPAAAPKPQVVEINGRPVGTRTPDLYRVKVAL
jgi:integrase